MTRWMEGCALMAGKGSDGKYAFTLTGTDRDRAWIASVPRGEDYMKVIDSQCVRWTIGELRKAIQGGCVDISAFAGDYYCAPAGCMAVGSRIIGADNEDVELLPLPAELGTFDARHLVVDRYGADGEVCSVSYTLANGGRVYCSGMTREDQVRKFAAEWNRIALKHGLKANRLRKGLTAQQVAERTGLTLRAVFKYESGEQKVRNMTLDKAVRYSRLLGLEMEAFSQMA